MKRLKIKFFDIDYMIKTDAEEDYVREIASYLEQKVKEISQQESSLAVPRSFLLAMLKITDDYFKVLKDFEDFKDGAEERSKRLVGILDNSLKEKEAAGFDEGVIREELGREELEDSYKYR
ncbi:MAG: cell division protein ZapA [Deltaproteobacteria bacterium]